MSNSGGGGCGTNLTLEAKHRDSTRYDEDRVNLAAETRSVSCRSPRDSDDYSRYAVIDDTVDAAASSHDILFLLQSQLQRQSDGA
jgi:hypothetical protein